MIAQNTAVERVYAELSTEAEERGFAAVSTISLDHFRSVSKLAEESSKPAASRRRTRRRARLARCRGQAGQHWDALTARHTPLFASVSPHLKPVQPRNPSPRADHWKKHGLALGSEGCLRPRHEGLEIASQSPAARSLIDQNLVHGLCIAVASPHVGRQNEEPSTDPISCPNSRIADHGLQVAEHVNREGRPLQPLPLPQVDMPGDTRQTA